MANTFHNDTDYTYDTYLTDNDAFDRNERTLQARDMQNWHEADVLATTRIALATCSGDGVAEEYYIDADQTQVIACPGCVNCEEPAYELVSLLENAPDLWEGVELEPAIAPKPMQPAIAASAPVPDSIPWTSTPRTLTTRYSPGYARIGNGLYVRSARRRA